MPGVSTANEAGVWVMELKGPSTRLWGTLTPQSQVTAPEKEGK